AALAGDRGLADVGVGHAAVVGVVDGLGGADQVRALAHAAVQIGIRQHLGLQRVALGLEPRDLGVLRRDLVGVVLQQLLARLVGVLQLRLQLGDGLGPGLGGFHRQPVHQDRPGALVAHGVLLGRLVVGAVIRRSGVTPIPDA